MDTVQIRCTLRNVASFLDVFPSDLLPSQAITRSCTIIVNADPHTEEGSHWLAIHLQPKTMSGFYFDSYGVVPLVPAIQAFLRRNCKTWTYNKRQLQGLTTDVCGKYCCLFSKFVDSGFTPQQFVALFDAGGVADKQVERLFVSEFGAHMPRGGCGQRCHACL